MSISNFTFIVWRFGPQSTLKSDRNEQIFRCHLNGVVNYKQRNELSNDDADANFNVSIRCEMYLQKDR